MLRLALGLLALLGSAGARAQPVPLLWRLADADSEVFLLGSVHVLTPLDYPLSPAVEAAYAGAETVAFEVDPGTMEAEAMRLLPRYGLDPAGRPLREVLPDSVHAALATALAARGLAVSAFDGVRPWVVSLAVGELALSESALRAEWGVDQHLYDRAVADGRETAALETAADQFAALAGLPEGVQVAQLAEALATMAEAPAQADSLVALWRTGDADALARFVKSEGATQPLALKAMLGRRNRAWVAPIEALLAEDGADALVVVGAAHLVGPESVVALLRARGHTVERVP